MHKTNDGGRRVAGFSRRIGITNSFVAELWGLREGLMLCCRHNISSLVVELDAKAIVDVLGNPSYVNNIVSPILDNCRRLVPCFQQIQFKHCFRQANRCADSLARLSLSQEAEFSSFDSPPVDMENVFEDNLDGMYFDRICLELIVVCRFLVFVNESSFHHPKKKKKNDKSYL